MAGPPVASALLSVATVGRLEATVLVTAVDACSSLVIATVSLLLLVVWLACVGIPEATMMQ